jgi:hypothetical protein
MFPNAFADTDSSLRLQPILKARNLASLSARPASSVTHII